MRIVIKLGTNLLTCGDGTLNYGLIERLVGEAAALRRAGHQVVLVSSGAIGAGMGRIGVGVRPEALREKQALAAVGQPLLMSAYQDFFSKHGCPVAQVLLTRYDLDDRRRYLNARDTMLALLEMGVVPIVNENDTVAVEEINFGDNDTLAALVAAKVSADRLFLLTDVEGLYRGLPGQSELLEVVEEITPEIEACASGSSSSGRGVGGMRTKLAAGKVATSAGVAMVIAKGTVERVVERVLAGERVGTLFLPHGHLESRKCWIAFGAACRGAVTVDEGAVRALTEKGRSLLPSGILAVEGSFETGDTVSIVTEAGREIGRGLTYYSSEEIDRVKGKKTSEIKEIIEGAGFDEVIHRDNMVIL